MKNSPRLLFLDVLKEDERLVKKKFPTAKIVNRALSDGEIVKANAETEILCVSYRCKLDRETITGLKNLKLIVTRSVGYDHIDLIAAKERKISVCNVPDYGAHVISEFVFALLLSGLRQIPSGDVQVENSKAFSSKGLRGIALKGKTLGLVGTGKIGANVARIASLGFLMNVIAYDPKPDKELARANHFRYARLETIWKNSDIISLHCPLLPTTKHIVNAKSIALMKKGVTIVNTSRGGIIDAKALVKALKSKKVSHAFLDVLEHENDLAQERELINLPQVIVTPHIAFFADDSMGKMYESAISSIKAFLNKKPPLGLVSGV